MGEFRLTAGMALLCALLPAAVLASPLDPSERRSVINDGDTLTLQDLGDEHYSVTRTEDGYLVVADEKNVFYYADENGEPSKFKARNPHRRKSAERAFLNGLNREKTFREHRRRTPDRFADRDMEHRVAPAPWVPKVLPKSHHSAGKLRFPIILVAGEANGLQNFDSAGMYARLNVAGYNEDDYLGSARDYFVDQSSGVFEPQFDIFLVSESEPFSGYIGKEAEFMKRAVLSMLEKYPSFDASLYDYDNDGEIDAFGVMYAGSRYKLGTKHLGGFQTTLKKYSSVVETPDGKKFNTCFIIDQGASHVVQLIHEFSHTMGLKDHYCVRMSGCSAYYADSAYQAPGAHAWDVMATGMYNGNYRKPPNYSAFERNFMGWLDYTTLEVDSQVKALPPLGTNNFAYYVNVNDKEWYVFENRQQVKWDSGLPNHGMLVWHIEFNSGAWTLDAMNDVPEHQRVDIVEAGDIRVLSQTGGYMSQGGGARQKDDPFPGSLDVTKLSPVLAWDSSVVLAGLFNIVEPDTNVCFVLDSTVAVENCEFIRVSSSSFALESSSSSLGSSSGEESSSSAQFESSSSVESSSSIQSSSSQVESSSSVMESSSSAESSSSFEPESSFSTTFAGRDVPGAAGFHIAMEGRTLEIRVSESGMKIVRVFDMQGNALASASFAGQSHRLDLGRIAHGSPLVVRLELGGRLAGYFRVAPAVR